MDKQELRLTPEEARLTGLSREEYTDSNFAGHSYLHEILITQFSNRATAISLACIAVIVLMAIFAPILSPYSYREVHSEATNLPMRIPGLEKLGIFDGTRAGVISTSATACPTSITTSARTTSAATSGPACGPARASRCSSRCWPWRWTCSSASPTA